MKYISPIVDNKDIITKEYLDNQTFASGAGQVNKVWKTDENGQPAWREEKDKEETYSTEINFIDTGFINKFKDNYDVEKSNTWNWQTLGNNITALVNQTTGKSITITGLETADEFLTVSEIDEIWAEVVG